MSSGNQKSDKPSSKSREVVPSAGGSEISSRVEKRDFSWYGGRVIEERINRVSTIRSSMVSCGPKTK
jgi:hypothetical protein